MSLLTVLAYPEIIAAVLIFAVIHWEELKRFGKSVTWEAEKCD